MSNNDTNSGTQTNRQHNSTTITHESLPPQDQWIGDAFNNNKPPTTLRLAFQNINGLGSHQYKHNLSLLVNEQITLDIDIMGMTEHCINTQYQDTLKTLQHQTVRQATREKTTLQIDASDTVTKTRYLPGGTAILLIGNTVGRIEPNGRGGDSMG